MKGEKLCFGIRKNRSRNHRLRLRYLKHSKQKKWQPTFGETKKKGEKPPEVTTKSEPKIDWEDKFLKTFQKLTYRRRAWDVWRDYILLHACSISNVLDKDNYDQREKLYLKIIHQYSKEEQAIFPELAAYTTMALDQNQEKDFLGKMFMRLDLGIRSAGQFFTPYHVCELMAEVVATNALEKIEQYGYISINDPCCGAGATLIASVHVIRKQLEHCEPPRNYQNHILVVAQDVDEIVGLMCYIQISLLGLAGFIKIGNSITDPISTDDSSEKYWYTPMYFSDVWSTRRMLRQINKLFGKGDDE